MDKEVKLIQSVQRAMDIINCFTELRYNLTLNEISEMLELNINTVRGLVNTLVYNGVLVHNVDDNTYGLGLYFLTKGNILQKQIANYITSVKPKLDLLAEKYHTSASIQLVDQRKIYSIYCSYPVNTAYTIVLSDYVALPLYATSSGKLLTYYNLYKEDKDFLKTLDYQKLTEHTIADEKSLLKNLQSIGKCGYSLELEEFALGVGSLAVPVLNADGHLLATVSVSMFASYLPSVKKELYHDLKQIADLVSEKLNPVQEN